MTNAGERQSIEAGRIVFRLPITVVVPLEVTAADGFTVKREWAMKPAKPRRLFVEVPSEAAWARLRVKSMDPCITKYEAHMLQLLPETPFSDPLCEMLRSFTLEPGGVKKMFFRVNAGRTLECCLAKEWRDSNCSGQLKVKLDFHGSRPLSSGRIDFVSHDTGLAALKDGLTAVKLGLAGAMLGLTGAKLGLTGAKFGRAGGTIRPERGNTRSDRAEFDQTNQSDGSRPKAQLQTLPIYEI